MASSPGKPFSPYSNSCPRMLFSPLTMNISLR